MARTTSHPTPGPTVQLQSARGTWRGKLPHARRTPAQAGKGEVRDALGRGLLKSWKRFRRRAEEGVPGPRSRKFDDAVHDLRSAARRFHSIARALPPGVSGKPVRRAKKSASRILSWTGSIRDIAVEREGLKAVVRSDSKVARGLDRRLKADHDRTSKKLARRLSTLGLRKTGRGMRRIAKGLRTDPKGGILASEMMTTAFDEVAQARRAVDPTDAPSVHRLRIAVKRFRYILELFEAVYPPLRGDRAASVQSLQRTMGDIRDNELLAGSLASLGKKDPDRLPDTAEALEKLERRHSGMMTSFLKSVDAILDYWRGLVDSFRRGLQSR